MRPSSAICTAVRRGGARWLPPAADELLQPPCPISSVKRFYRFGLFLAERLFAAMPQPEPVRLDAAVQQLNARLKTEKAI